MQQKRKSKAKKNDGRRKKISRSGKKPEGRILKGSYALAFAAALLLSVAFAAIFPYLRDRKAETGCRLPSGNFRYGIDISSYQKEIVWDSLKILVDTKDRTVRSIARADDVLKVSFVFIKATEGQNHRDRKFREHWANAGEKGIPRAGYHFFRSSKSAVKQAENFIRVMEAVDPGEMPPILDIETIHDGCTKEELNASARIWLETVEARLGTKPVIYSYDNFINDILDKELLSEYDVWCANYNGSEPHFEDWHIWQFSDRGVVYGIDGFTDLNAIRPAPGSNP